MTTYQDELATLTVEEARAAKRIAARLLAKQQNKANNALYELGLTFHDFVPLDTVASILDKNGFDPLEEMILCGREGRLNEPIGRNRWLSLTWYKMESGRYEVVAYVS